MSEPTTEAGRIEEAWDALYADIAAEWNSPRRDTGPLIRSHRPLIEAAIEAEARASQPLTLDVERLKAALQSLHWTAFTYHEDDYSDLAAGIAAAYTADIGT